MPKLSPNMAWPPCHENTDNLYNPINLTNNFDYFPLPQQLSPNHDARDSQWNSIVLLGAVVTILIIFIITMIAYSIYFRLYSNRLQPRRRTVFSHRFSWRGLHDYHFMTSPREQGLSRATMEALPVFVYKAEDFSDVLRCAVCLSEFEENENGRVLPNCGHRFHADCIGMWFYSHSTCPLCRQGVGLQPENGHVVVEVSSGGEEESDSNEKEVRDDESGSAELKDDDSHRMKDVQDQRRLDVAISTLNIER